MQTTGGNPTGREGVSAADNILFSSRGFDRIEFFFSANPGESPKPLVKVASSGEASRLMLILKTSAKTHEGEKSAVFDEIDAGITNIRRCGTFVSVRKAIHQPASSEGAA